MVYLADGEEQARREDKTDPLKNVSLRVELITPKMKLSRSDFLLSRPRLAPRYTQLLSLRERVKLSGQVSPG
ncbi:hypothetical protein E2C01_068382 [Portunus trituberculatus]|uniref:Uncharacterized protein n=1 Tax=Portunus trituberculatus TaxID=210409 RepID=A0A5B7HXQ6_PORTR|nr:hypothetical protein [Portunus trituberculatus]